MVQLRCYLMSWALITCLVGQGSALIGYDCETPAINITTIAINEVADCSPEPTNYETVDLEVQVIQREEIQEQWVRSCLVEVVRTIFHCGMSSHSTAVAGGVSTYIHTLGAEECNESHRQKSLSFHGHYINQLKINGTVSASVIIFGQVDISGTCKGATFTENDRTWTDVVVQGALKIKLMEGLAKVKLGSDEITLPGGVICPFLNGYCTDSTYGETVWRMVPRVHCKDVATLYQGKAQQVRDKKRGTSYLVVEEADRVFAVTLLTQSSVCERIGWQTEHPQILVINTTRERPIGDQHGVTTPNVDLLAYINSKFMYVEQANKRHLEHMYIDTVYRRCQLHREILKNRLLTAPLSPSAVGWIIKQQRGFIGRVLGEVLYLMQCTPRPATLRRSDRCYNELPVSVNNQSRYLSPTTHILLTHAEEINCSPLTPPMFSINNRWIGLIPEPVIRDSPVILEPELENAIPFAPIRPVGSGGLYTNDEVTRSQKLILFGAERRAVENVIVRKISGEQTDNQGLHSIGLFDEEELRNLANSTMKQIWGWFTDFGIFISGLMGLYVILQLVKYVLGVAINSWQIYRTVGCGISVVASLWDTLTLWVLHRHYTTKSEEEMELKEVTTEQPSAPDYSVMLGHHPPATIPPRHWSEVM